MGKKKQKEENITQELREFYWNSKIYELRENVLMRRSWVSLLEVAYLLARYEEDVDDSKDDEAFVRIPPIRPASADEQYRNYDKKMVDELKDLKFSRRQTYLEKRSWFIRALGTLLWYTHPAPRELKKLVKNDYIHDFPGNE